MISCGALLPVLRPRTGTRSWGDRRRARDQLTFSIPSCGARPLLDSANLAHYPLLRDHALAFPGRSEPGGATRKQRMGKHCASGVGIEMVPDSGGSVCAPSQKLRGSRCADRLVLADRTSGMG